MIPYLKTFFEEKKLPFASWELEDEGGVMHFIDSDVVLEHIELASTQEQHQVAEVIRMIDFNNEDVNDFLKHLAGALINPED